MAGSESTIGLLEQCLPLTEDRYLCSFYGEPWCPLTMLGAIMLLKMHLGKESRQTAKSSCAQRFIGLYYKRFRGQETSHCNQQYLPPPSAASQVAVSISPVLYCSCDVLDLPQLTLNGIIYAIL